MVVWTDSKKTKEESCGDCQSCGAEVKSGVCLGCMMDPDACICDKDVTSSISAIGPVSMVLSMG